MPSSEYTQWNYKGVVVPFFGSTLKFPSSLNGYQVKQVSLGGTIYDGCNNFLYLYFDGVEKIIVPENVVIQGINGDEYGHPYGRESKVDGIFFDDLNEIQCDESQRANATRAWGQEEYNPHLVTFPWWIRQENNS